MLQQVREYCTRGGEGRPESVRVDIPAGRWTDIVTLLPIKCVYLSHPNPDIITGRLKFQQNVLMDVRERSVLDKQFLTKDVELPNIHSDLDAV